MEGCFGSSTMVFLRPRGLLQITYLYLLHTSVHHRIQMITLVLNIMQPIFDLWFAYFCLHGKFCQATRVKSSSWDQHSFIC